MSDVVLTLEDKALRILSLLSLAINAALAAWRALRLSLRICELGILVRAGSWSLDVDGRLGFLPRASWKGENPATF